MKGKYIVTTDNWFYAPDGNSYKAVWGEISIFEDTFLGIKTNRNSSNWYAKIGTEENHVIVAGCQIHYATRCENRPSQTFQHELTHELEVKSVVADTPRIYIAE
jgi:aspartate ammonia-lyase